MSLSMLASELVHKTLWYPTILGILVVVAGIALFCGSIYVLLATNLVNLAGLASLEGEFATAEANYREALGIWRTGELYAEAASALHGLGRDGLQMKGLAMRLFHLGLDAHVVGEMTTPPVGTGDLLICSAATSPASRR